MIKHGALGDMVLATGAFAALRGHHGGDHVTLLTTPAFESLGRDSGLFDAVEVDRRLRAPFAFLAQVIRLRRARFDVVYDLQGSDRAAFYRILTWPRTRRWSRPNPKERALPPQERHAAQLRRNGVRIVPAPNVGFLDGDLARFDLPARFVLMAPGSAEDRPEKRWPWQDYVEVAKRLRLPVVLVGTRAESDVTNRIAGAAPEAIDLCSRTTLGELAALARRARVAIGNDTGPMHVFAAVGCPSVVIFTATGDPAVSAPLGSHVEVCMDARPDDVVRAAGRVAP